MLMLQCYVAHGWKEPGRFFSDMGDRNEVEEGRKSNALDYCERRERERGRERERERVKVGGWGWRSAKKSLFLLLAATLGTLSSCKTDSSKLKYCCKLLTTTKR
jgi:hypothetical protein